MEQSDYAEFVKTLKKPGSDIIGDLTESSADSLHMAVGVAGEAGELLDAIKKYSIYNKPLDRENVVEELGDLEFFMEGLRQRLEISREETLVHNRAKLNKRYADKKFSNEAAQIRADKP